MWWEAIVSLTHLTALFHNIVTGLDNEMAFRIQDSKQMRHHGTVTRAQTLGITKLKAKLLDICNTFQTLIYLRTR